MLSLVLYYFASRKSPNANITVQNRLRWVKNKLHGRISNFKRNTNYQSSLITRKTRHTETVKTILKMSFPSRELERFRSIIISDFYNLRSFF